MPSETEPLLGSCLCGGVRFTICGEFSYATTYCHCTHCQKRTGSSSSAQDRIAAEHLSCSRGIELLRTFTPPQGRPKMFWSVCGSSLFGGTLHSGEVVSVRFGLLDGDPGIRPRARGFVGSAASWDSILDDGLPRFDGPRPA